VGLYTEQILPRLENRVMDTAQSRETRARVCAGLHGTVLEIGFGSGLNLPHLPPEVRELWAVDPSETGRRLAAERRAASPVAVVFAAADATTLPFDDAVFDSALSTWTICSLPDPVGALREVGRVLRPGARLHFVEHGLAADPAVARRQHRWDPLQRRLAGGCTLSRDIPGLLGAAGFATYDLTTYYEPGTPKVVGYTYEGRAVRE
jgi:ubiquinone/menaquinone biosynthesis C-methylase UbiE